MNFGLIIVGDEILSGKRSDKHLPKVIELLAARGLALSWVRYVGDDPQRITADLQDAFASGDIVFCCGGIGATPDDHTRQSAAAALGVALALNPQAGDLVIERMRDVAREKGQAFEPDRDDNRHRLNMAVFPEGAEIIPNPYNKIAGFSASRGAGGVFFVPGFPVMAWPMIESVLDQPLCRTCMASARQTSNGRSIVFGAMEASADTDDGSRWKRRFRGCQGVQPAERRPPGIRPRTSNSASRATGNRSDRGLRRRLKSTGCCAFTVRLGWALNWCDETEPDRCDEVHLSGLYRCSPGTGVSNAHKPSVGTVHARAWGFLPRKLASTTTLCDPRQEIYLNGKQKRRRRDEDGQGEAKSSSLISASPTPAARNST